VEWEDGVPVVDAEANGMACPFLVDTGTNQTTISLELAQNLRLPIAPPDSGYVDGSNTWRFAAGRTSLASLRLGTRVYRQVAVDVEDSSLINQVFEHPICGILGTDLFESDVLVLDGPAHALALSQDALPDPDGQRTLPLFRTFSGQWWVEVDLNGRRVAVYVDSGAEGGMRLSARLWARQPWMGSPIVVGKAYGVQSSQDREVARLRGPIRVGQFTLARPVLERGLSGSSLGAAILRKFRVTMDFPGRRIRFERAGLEPILSPPIVTSGIGVARSAEGMHVAYVLDGWEGMGEAQPGDRILSIRKSTGQDAGAARSRALKCVLVHDGRQFEVTVPILELLPDAEP
jgi:hypothetical protein